MLEKSVHVLSLKEKKPNYVVQYIVVDFFKITKYWHPISVKLDRRRLIEVVKEDVQMVAVAGGRWQEMSCGDPLREQLKEDDDDSDTHC